MGGSCRVGAKEAEAESEAEAEERERERGGVCLLVRE